MLEYPTFKIDRLIKYSAIIGAERSYSAILYRDSRESIDLIPKSSHLKCKRILPIQAGNIPPQPQVKEEFN